MSLVAGSVQSAARALAFESDQDPSCGTLHTIRLPSKNGRREEETIMVRLADTDDEKSSATTLINRMYSWRGYGSDHRLTAAPHCVTFTAASEEEVLGTLTLTVDSPAGLAVDNTFAEELQKFRKIPGANLCELTKFAFDSTGPSRPILAALFHIIFIYGSRRYKCTDLFIEVNPRHCRFYEVMLDFKRVGALRTNASVNAPSQLMWLKVLDIRRNIDKHAGDNPDTGRSLYPQFFSPKEEHGIYKRLSRMITTH